MVPHMKWVSAPPITRNVRGTDLKQKIAQLDTRPGQWAILREYDNAQSAHPTATRLRLRFNGHYEFVARRVGKGSALYGRKIKK